MKNETKYTVIRSVVIIVMFMLLFLAVLNHFDTVLTDEMIEEGTPLFKEAIIAFLMFLLVNYISIILHEIGHLLFGLKSRLEFISFNIKGLSFVKENKKIVVKRIPIPKDFGGYCNMRFQESVKYSSKDVISYFSGGIIVNVLLAIIFIIPLILVTNNYIKLLSLMFIIYNLYLAIYNAVPYVNLLGVNTDMMHIVNYLHDNKYINKLQIIDKVIKYREKNSSLKNIDKNLVYMPKEFLNNSDITIATIYIAYLSEKKEYKKMDESIDYVLKTIGDKISISNINSLKVQKIDCIIHTTFDKNEIMDLWDIGFSNYINQISRISIEGLVFKYLYYKIMEDDNKANEILNLFNNKKIKYHDKQEVIESEDLIHDIDSLINKNSNN